MTPMPPSAMNAILQTSTQSVAQEPAAQTNVTPAALGGKFQALMQQAPMAPPQTIGAEGGSLVSKIANSLDAQLNAPVRDLMNWAQNPQMMNQAQAAAYATKVIAETTTANATMSVTVSMVTSSKSALETLMRNQ
ncbi:hypothetical protein [Paraburkholderia humisilvae]|uniref:Type III secretion protein HrpB2 n=1 Tax=Paraburkholderia humisilvae TaxID=627669 RepID=A0A6J5F6S9_9BURK|nr:hypothetical protein [Paraburkholderia humisilvae]CAB3772866.1 hypothetical protein LMG29542_07002 [Paraburkholderia humisilvae]